MADKPKRASEYKSEHLELVRETCLYVATTLGDLMDELVVVGGLTTFCAISGMAWRTYRRACTRCWPTRRHGARSRYCAMTFSTTKGLAREGSRSSCMADKTPSPRPTWLAL